MPESEAFGADRRARFDFFLYAIAMFSLLFAFLTQPCSRRKEVRTHVRCVVSIIPGSARESATRDGPRRVSRNCEAATLQNEDGNVAAARRPNDPMPASVPVISVSISRDYVCRDRRLASSNEGR